MSRTRNMTSKALASAMRPMLLPAVDINSRKPNALVKASE